MDEMEDKISAILNNPQMMQQIMTMAQSFSSTPQQPMPSPSPAPQLDLGMIQKLSGFVQQSGMDKRETALLTALHAYLSTDRIQRLERAMRAAKLAGVATSFLGSSSLFSGR